MLQPLTPELRPFVDHARIVLQLSTLLSDYLTPSSPSTPLRPALGSVLAHGNVSPSCVSSPLDLKTRRRASDKSSKSSGRTRTETRHEDQNQSQPFRAEADKPVNDTTAPGPGQRVTNRCVIACQFYPDFASHSAATNTLRGSPSTLLQCVRCQILVPSSPTPCSAESSPLRLWSQTAEPCRTSCQR